MTRPDAHDQRLINKARRYIGGYIELSQRAADELAEQLDWLGYQNLADKVAKA